jgi:hypothetical protein
MLIESKKEDFMKASRDLSHLPNGPNLVLSTLTDISISDLDVQSMKQLTKEIKTSLNDIHIKSNEPLIMQLTWTMMDST